MDITGKKAALRTEIRAARKNISEKTRMRGQIALARALLPLQAIMGARIIGIYQASGSELSLSPLVAGLRGSDLAPFVSYPLVLDSEHMVFARIPPNVAAKLLAKPKDVVENPERFKIVLPDELDTLIVPGIAFDEKCHRLGQGGGYYDRYIPQLREGALTIGVAFDEQIVSEIPHDKLDQPVQMVVTPTRIITC